MNKNNTYLFLNNQAKHSKYGLLVQILNASNNFWGENHDFFPWLFPLNNPSKWNPNSPVLAEEEMKLIRESKEIQNNIKKTVSRYQSFLASSPKWQKGYSHEHLRISRAIRSLRLTSNDESANSFKHWIARELGDNIDKVDLESKSLWRLS